MELVGQERDAEEDGQDARAGQNQHGGARDEEKDAENDAADSDGVLDHAGPRAAPELWPCPPETVNARTAADD
jgi:hypothetical protein